MKRIVTLLVLLLINQTITVAQSLSTKSTQGDKSKKTQTLTPDESNISYQLGDKRIIIPSPRGFEEAASKIELVKTIFSKTEDPSLDVLAVHLPTEIVEKMKKGSTDNLTFYTKVSVSKKFREVDTSPSDFSALVSHVQTNSAKVFDFNSPENKSSLNNLNKSLSDLSGQEAKLDLSTPVNLGEIVKTPELYGTLLLVKTKLQTGNTEEDVIMLAGASFIRVKQRLIFVYTYRTFNSDKDIEILRDFTKKWLEEIVKAN